MSEEMKKVRLAKAGPAEKADVAKINAAQRRRLRKIDLLLAWDGSLSRGDLSEFFGISDQQASADIAKYREVAPDNLRYETRDKTYYVSDQFIPAFMEISADRYLSQLEGLQRNVLDRTQTGFRDPPSSDLVPYFQPDVSNGILINILKAIREKCAAQITYQPLTSVEKSTYYIAPHAIAFSGRRWHVRAWSFKSEEFRDFVLTRIRKVSEFADIELGPDDISVEEADIEWNEFLSIRIVPCVDLPEEQREVIAKDYGMKGGFREVEIRKALVFYFVDWHRLDPRQHGNIPSKFRMIEAENWGEIEQHVPDVDNEKANEKKKPSVKSRKK